VGLAEFGTAFSMAGWRKDGRRNSIFKPFGQRRNARGCKKLLYSSKCQLEGNGMVRRLLLLIFYGFFLIGGLFSLPPEEDVEFLIQNNFFSGIAFTGDESPGKIDLQLEETNELKLLLKLMLAEYKLFISSQDKPSCNFTPSCSQYTKEAITKYGPVMGIIRLLQCYNRI